VHVLDHDVVGEPCRWDVILCGDVCYEGKMTRHILPWLRGMARCCAVCIADPGRAYLPAAGLTLMATYTVATSMELEDRTERETRVYRLHADPE
jgi:predicted nicotinamide N-methyase